MAKLKRKLPLNPKKKQNIVQCELLLIRHADAGDSKKWLTAGLADADRPLSLKGKSQFKRLVPKLRKLMTPKAIIQSEKLRSQQTVKIFMKGQKNVSVLESNLIGDSYTFADTYKYVDLCLRNYGQLVVVGHEPSLSHFATQLVLKTEDKREGNRTRSKTNEEIKPSIFQFKKGAAMLLRKINGQWLISWMLPPKFV